MAGLARVSARARRLQPAHDFLTGPVLSRARYLAVRRGVSRFGATSGSLRGRTHRRWRGPSRTAQAPLNLSGARDAREIREPLSRPGSAGDPSRALFRPILSWLP